MSEIDHSTDCFGDALLTELLCHPLLEAFYVSRSMHPSYWSVLRVLVPIERALQLRIATLSEYSFGIYGVLSSYSVRGVSFLV